MRGPVVTDTPAKNQQLSEAGRAGIQKRLDEVGADALSAPARAALQRIREVEQALDPNRLLDRAERRAAARLIISLEDGERQFAELAERVMKQRAAFAAKRATVEQLTALAAA
jgi:hypothetical protein